MKKSFKEKVIASVMSLLAAVFLLLTPIVTFAQTANEDNPNLANRIQQLYTFGIGIIGFLALAGTIIGGFIYLTSAGNAERAGRAKTTIISSVAGLAIALLSVFILNIFSPQFTKFSGDWFLPGNIVDGPHDTPDGCRDYTCGYVQKSDGKYYCLGPEKDSCKGALEGSFKQIHAACENTAECATPLACKSYAYSSSSFAVSCENAACKPYGGECKTNSDCCGNSLMACNTTTHKCDRGELEGLNSNCVPDSADPSLKCPSHLSCSPYPVGNGTTAYSCLNPEDDPAIQCAAGGEAYSSTKPCCGQGVLVQQNGRCVPK